MSFNYNAKIIYPNIDERIASFVVISTSPFPRILRMAEDRKKNYAQTRTVPSSSSRAVRCCILAMSRRTMAIVR